MKPRREANVARRVWASNIAASSASINSFTNSAMNCRGARACIPGGLYMTMPDGFTASFCEYCAMAACFCCDVASGPSPMPGKR
jgi:hypothetical protein